MACEQQVKVSKEHANKLQLSANKLQVRVTLPLSCTVDFLYRLHFFG